MLQNNTHGVFEQIRGSCTLCRYFISLPLVCTVWNRFNNNAIIMIFLLKTQFVFIIVYCWFIAQITPRRRDLDRMVFRFPTTYSIIAYHTKAVSLNPAHGVVYSMQHYVKKFASALRISMVFTGYSVPSTNKTDRHDIAELLLKVLSNTIAITPLRTKPPSLYCNLLFISCLPLKHQTYSLLLLQCYS